MSNRTVRKILHDLKFHPFTMMIVQELIGCDWGNRMACGETIL